MTSPQRRTNPSVSGHQDLPVTPFCGPSKALQLLVAGDSAIEIEPSNVLSFMICAGRPVAELAGQVLQALAESQLGQEVAGSLLGLLATLEAAELVTTSRFSDTRFRINADYVPVCRQ